MPELPDIEAYRTALEDRVLGQPLVRARIISFSVLKTFDPPIEDLHGQEVTATRRLGKRVCVGFAPDRWIVIHLMITGRLRWYDEAGKAVPKKVGHGAFDFPSGTLLLTEQGTKKRAGIWVHGSWDAAVDEHDRGGVEPLELDLAAFREALTRENRTVKRALTDPRILSGIGNAFSDEILLAAYLSPVKTTSRLDQDEFERLYRATQDVLTTWTDRLVAEAHDTFPEKVTAFREEFGAHGRYGQPCPQCGDPIQRIRYADNETNYCATCQTGGKLLADRALSRILKDDWPRSLDELDA